eukprot:9483118-Pyramimonas_sp.AAC.2
MAAAGSGNYSQEGSLSPAAPPPGHRNLWGPLSDNVAKPLPPPPGPAPKSLARPSDSGQIPKGGAQAPPPDIQGM